MSDFFLALRISIYENRFSLLAILITCVSWVVFAQFVTNTLGRAAVDLIVYALTGWYWLGRVVNPWVEQKLEEIFDY